MATDLSEQKNAIILCLDQLEIQNFSQENSAEELQQLLSRYLNNLIASDFNKLIGILYRIDISQEKAIAALAELRKDETDGEILANLIIARQKEKIHFRKLYSK